MPVKGTSTVYLLRWPLVLAIVALVSQADGARAAGVTWEEQAQRLQNVNASFLDALPFLEPPAVDSLTLGLRSSVSVLPRVNATIGAKTEKVPQAPVHAVPTVQLGGLGRGGSLRGLFWIGALPPGAQRLFGIDASFSQWLVGGALGVQGALWGLPLWVPLGVQYGAAALSGSITAAGAHDTFSGRTVLVSFAPGVTLWNGFWLNLSLSHKRTKSVFKIPSDATSLSITDVLHDQPWGLVTQGAGGWHLPGTGLTVGAGVQWTPGRLIMPRILVAYAAGKNP